MSTKPIILLAALVLAGCASEPVRSLQASVQQMFQEHKGGESLAAGLRHYENARYAESAKALQSALDLGLADGDQVTAHKHLAFIHCAERRERQCRDEFRKALAIDPALELAPAEAGHPVWGPVFRALKAAR
jgi:Tfp pilus assembly protein PilF